MPAYTTEELENMTYTTKQMQVLRVIDNLLKAGIPATVAEITRTLKENGVQTSTANVAQTYLAALERKGAIVRVPGGSVIIDEKRGRKALANVNLPALASPEVEKLPLRLKQTLSYIHKCLAGIIDPQKPHSPTLDEIARNAYSDSQGPITVTPVSVFEWITKLKGLGMVESRRRQTQSLVLSPNFIETLKTPAPTVQQPQIPVQPIAMPMTEQTPQSVSTQPQSIVQPAEVDNQLTPIVASRWVRANCWFIKKASA